MIRFLTTTLFVLAITACSSGGDDDSGNNVRPCAAGAGTFVDPSGDTPFQFIDLTNVSVTVTATDITAAIDLVRIPAVLNYNDPGTPDNAMEYGWQVKFDVNGDGDCFSDGDIGLAVLHFKPALATVASVVSLI